MAGVVLPVSLTSEQANIIMELIKRRVQLIERIYRDAEVIMSPKIKVIMSPEIKQLRDDLRDLANWIWDCFGNEIKEENLL